MSYSESTARAQESYKLDPALDGDKIDRVCRKTDRSPDRSFTRAQKICHLRVTFAGRHGQHLPDSEKGREHLLTLLRILAAIPKVKTTTLTKEVERWAPWASKSETAQMVATAERTPCVFRKETLGRLIGLVDAERKQFKAWSIWPIDLSLAESKLRQKERDKQYQHNRRRSQDKPSRSEYLAKVKSKSPEPCLAYGLKRTKYFELKAAGMLPDQVRTGCVGHIKEDSNKKGYTSDEPSPEAPASPEPAKPSGRLPPRSAVIDELLSKYSDLNALRRPFRPKQGALIDSSGG